MDASPSQGVQQPQRFDADSAIPEPTEKILEGSAYVVDGDTIKIQKTQVRLFGVDAPEINHPYGKKAKWALVSLCKGQKVRAVVTAEDTHGRTVAKCYLEDGRDLSAEMVKLGMAIDWPKFSDGKYKSLEVPDVRKKLWLADARQKGRTKVWEQFEAKQAQRNQNK
ncbi:thermonuclease family protein [Ruegeria atlantica]|uniref:thermonuclease family protein n=1 Tax=Ruegeria atlantica TaxID=81569 RepID=UPI002495A379|nr:thermonuclease family protein [Ruegeria atlantica]